MSEKGKIKNEKHIQNKALKAIRYIFKPFFLLFFGMKTKGIENLPGDRGYVICCNHISWLDPVVCYFQTKRFVRYMVKPGLYNSRIKKWFFSNLGCFPVDTKGGFDTIGHATKMVKEGNIVGMFPEGTRSKDGKPKRGKLGVAVITNAAEVDVVPMALICKGRVIPFRKIRLIIGKPIPYSEVHFEPDDRRGMKAASERIMSEITKLWEQGHNEH